MHELQRLVQLQKNGVAQGICSVCSGSPFVIDAAILQAKRAGTTVLIEATANQVNQFGGYTGMKPADFRSYVFGRAEALGLDTERIILGGDHLGPVVWRKKSAAEAMELAQTLVFEFAKAGYGKIHLDASMPLGTDTLLQTEEIALRSARLCRAAESGFEAFRRDHPQAEPPVYIIGSEVPTPGGSGEEDGLSVTRPEALEKMLSCFEKTFEENGLRGAFSRVVGAVVQPGVEFGNDSIHAYAPAEAAKLTASAKALSNIILEGHSTDYQTSECLRQLVCDGVAILKVGPALTFAAREGLFALSFMEKELPVAEPSDFMEVLEEAMLREPSNWQGHYPAREPRAGFMRRFSQSDRSRYYMSAPAVTAATEKLLHNLSEQPLPLTLLSQFLPNQYQAIRSGKLANEPRALVLDKVREVLDVYWQACGLSL